MCVYAHTHCTYLCNRMTLSCYLYTAVLKTTKVNSQLTDSQLTLVRLVSKMCFNCKTTPTNGTDCSCHSTVSLHYMNNDYMWYYICSIWFLDIIKTCSCSKLFEMCHFIRTLKFPLKYILSYSFYMTAIVQSVSEEGGPLKLKCVIDTNLIRPQQLSTSHYFHFNSHLKQLHISNKTEYFSYKGMCGICGCHMCIKAFKRTADLRCR